MTDRQKLSRKLRTARRVLRYAERSLKAASGDITKTETVKQRIARATALLLTNP